MAIVERDHSRPNAALGRPFHVLLAAVLIFGLANSSDTLLLLRARAAGLSVAQLAFLFDAFNLVYAILAVPTGALIKAWITASCRSTGWDRRSR